MGAAIPRCSARAAKRAMSDALEEAGCLVVADVADAETREAVTRELAPHFEKAPVKTSDDAADFYPGHTRRVTALVARSEAVAG